jgi:hypothetical protein
MVGPGFQMAQVFVEAIFERHVNWIELILTDDYKNILQVKIQKEFKITPDYIEMGAGRARTGTRWACFSVWDKKYTPLNTRTLPVTDFSSFQEIHNYMSIHNRILVFLGEGTHKLKTGGATGAPDRHRQHRRVLGRIRLKRFIILLLYLRFV